MSLNQQLIAEFSPCTPRAPQLRDLSIQTVRQLALRSFVDECLGDLASTEPLVWSNLEGGAASGVEVFR
jgi:hypothetical protein